MLKIRKELTDWLTRVCQSENPPSSIVAYNIGLFETRNGYTAYLAGAERFDESDSYWACEETFTPSERYLPLNCDEPVGWQQLQREVCVAVRAFVRSPQGHRSFVARATAITVGFDDGDLERVI